MFLLKFNDFEADESQELTYISMHLACNNLLIHLKKGKIEVHFVWYLKTKAADEHHLKGLNLSTNSLYSFNCLGTQ